MANDTQMWPPPRLRVLAQCLDIEDCSPGDDTCFEFYMHQQVQADFANTLLHADPRAPVDDPEFMYSKPNYENKK